MENLEEENPVLMVITDLFEGKEGVYLNTNNGKDNELTVKEVVERYGNPTEIVDDISVTDDEDGYDISIKVKTYTAGRENELIPRLKYKVRDILIDSGMFNYLVEPLHKEDSQFFNPKHHKPTSEIIETTTINGVTYGYYVEEYYVSIHFR